MAYSAESLLFVSIFQLVYSFPTSYYVGVGIADMTGPAADIDMMGYGKPSQRVDGIHMRQFSRAFVILDPDTQTRVAYVNTDTFMVSQAVKTEVIKELKKLFNSLYTERNVLIGATNTHSGPGGYSQYVLNDITSIGFVNETFLAHCHGIVSSIILADKNLQPANIYVNSGDLLDTNINRSPTAYLNNPESERKQYSYDVDKTMTVLKFVDAQNQPIGILSWFPVHGASMNNTNRLISGDNKGYASYLFEKLMNNKTLPGKGAFVAAFAQSNEGDASPNTRGPHCLNTGLPCHNTTSTCFGRNELCVASGPGKDMFESTKIIGENQFNKALELFNGATEPLSGPVDFRHTYTDMSQQEVLLTNKTKVKTCKPALGYSFGAGTTDGPGAFNFKQGSNSSSLLWNFVRDFIHDPSREQVVCHRPKPILLDTGETTLPFAWQPTSVDTQIIRIGRLVIIAVPAEFTYYVGVGIADMTGPAADIDMMGYGKPSQRVDGIHMRQFSRAFVILDPDTQTRVAYVNTDTFMVSQAVKTEVIKELKKLFNSLYTERNVLIGATNTHSGPGGYSQYVLNDITSIGFVNETFLAHCHGIVSSIILADKNLQPANIYVNSGDLLDTNINRSPTAYLNNPESERKQYSYDVDKTMTVLKFVDAQNQPIGILSWFPVHGASMNNTNRLISGDNKGYASYLFEKLMNNKTLPGKGAFVAAFAQSNEGDASPNTRGPHCLNTGLPCHNTTSTCFGRNELCVASGPGKDMFESTKIIGENQFNKALELFNGATEPLSGPVDFRHTYTDMSQQEVLLTNKTKVKTCKPALGYSFGAGTTDGPGAFNFKQGSNSSSLLWNFVRDFIHDPSREQVVCHRPKPILLDTGETTLPFAWQPTSVDTQIIRIGRLVIIAVPAEFTTMAGRRLQKAVENAMIKGGFPDQPMTVIAGLANDYANFVTTFEEYQVQRFEGGSTLYGPHTLEAFIQVYTNLTTALTTKEPVVPGPNPPDLLSKQMSFLPQISEDIDPSFGHVLKHPHHSYKQGDTVSVTFYGVTPRLKVNTVGTFNEDTFMGIVWRDDNNATSLEVANEGDWETQFIWRKHFLSTTTGEVDMEWRIPKDQLPGHYQIYYFCSYKNMYDYVTGCYGVTHFKVNGTSVK